MLKTNVTDIESYLNFMDQGLEFPNLPYYIDGDVKLTQSSAILRHIAREHGLMGKTGKEMDR